MVTETKASSIGVVIESRLITGTYTDLWACKDYLAVAMFDEETLDTKIKSQSINVKRKINTFLGRKTDFTEDELEQVQFAGICDSAAQWTACLVESRPQAASAAYVEDTIVDCQEAIKTLSNWAFNNGLEIPSEDAKIGHPLTELIYITNDSTAVI